MPKPRSKKIMPQVASSARAKVYLDRLDASGGKRQVIDLDAEANAALQGLLDGGYATEGTKKGVVRKALVSAYSQLKKK
jgi:hypothetical protein